MIDQPLNSFKNKELDYLAQILSAPLFTLHAVIHISLILKTKPSQTRYYKPTLCHQQVLVTLFSYLKLSPEQLTQSDIYLAVTTITVSPRNSPGRQRTRVEVPMCTCTSITKDALVPEPI